jgi:hypothetical protein
MVEILKLLLFMVFVIGNIHFRIRTRIRIRNPRVTDLDPDPAKVTDPYGSGSRSTTGILRQTCYMHGGITTGDGTVQYFLTLPECKNCC